MESFEFKVQKDELLRALKYLSPAITMKGQGNESLIGFEIKPGGVALIKAGANLTRTRTNVAWSGQPLTEPLAFSVESMYLANALRTLGIASEVRIKWRQDQRIEFLLPGGKGTHVIPILPDEFQSIESVIDGAESLFSETKKMELMDSVLRRAMTTWGLVSAAEREVSQMIVMDNKFTVCAPGFYFQEKVTGYPEKMKVHPQVAERTQKFLDKWKGHEVQFQILKTKRWNQTWGLLTVKVGETKEGESNTGAMWLFSVEIAEDEDVLSATILRMKEDMTNRQKEGNLTLIVTDASSLANQISAAVAVTEDSHAIGSVYRLKTTSKVVALVLTSQNAMSAQSSMGLQLEVETPLTDDFKDIIEWKVSLITEILSVFGKNRVVLTYDPTSKRTYITEYATAGSTTEFEKEAFMNHVGRVVACKTEKAPREKKERKPRKAAAVVVGGADEGFAEIMESLLDGSTESK